MAEIKPKYVQMQINPTKSVKRLYLVRHAKSSWKYDLPDFDRPLKKRGFNDAKLVSNHLKTFSLSPDLIISSGANRAKTTADIFVENLNLKSVNFIINNDVYDFSGESLLSVLKSCDKNIDKLLIFGHNYALTNIANTYGNTYIENITTSGFVEIHFNIDSWSQIKKGETKTILFPKHLK
ncbi:histidine phosphatase family protein [Lacinutrix sp. MedPE-SW]|uniref:SixA phosphatase family protein n=1 Tax=Lacinutrix sp. MedPE-SW TaxID=1860087 RepID=UPI000AED8CE1|nr:histidine phosphatase family protein [Lacinutrix sp. MedPE-SW]